MDDANEATAPSQPDVHAARDALRQLRREERRDRFAEILRLRQAGVTPRQIAPQIGMSVRTVERWLAAGGEPEHWRPPARYTCIDPFRDYLEQRLQDGTAEHAVITMLAQTGGEALDELTATWRELREATGEEPGLHKIP